MNAALKVILFLKYAKTCLGSLIYVLLRVHALLPLNRYFKTYAHLLLFGIVCVSASTFLATYQGVVIRRLTNSVCLNIPLVSNTYYLKEIIELIALALLSGLFMFLMRQTIIVMSRHIEFDQKNSLFSKLQLLKPHQIQNYTTGDLMNRIAEDVSRVRMYTGPAIMYIVNTLVTVITVLVFMLSISPRLTLFVFIPLPLLSFFIYKISLQIQTLSHRSQEALGGITSKAQESFNAIRLIKAYAMEPETQSEMEQQSETYKSAAIALSFRESLFGPLMTLMIGLSVWFTVWQGGILLSSGQIEPGNITEFILYVFRLTWPFASIGWVTALVQRAAASQERINHLLELPIEPSDNRHKKIYTVDSLSFNKVSYKYPNASQATLENINIHLPKGSVIGITGPIGCGKSTWVNLLTGQLNPNSGSIYINGISLDSLSVRDWRDVMSLVPQDVFLFSDTIYENIAFGTTEPVTMEDVIEASKAAQLHDTVMQFKETYQTLVGERGVMLSGGQKQRLALARALIRKSSVLVIDDGLNALDQITENAVMQTLQNKAKFDLIIFISHRLQQLQFSDTIYYFDKGQVIESGSHEALMNQNGSYARLFNLQCSAEA